MPTIEITLTRTDAGESPVPLVTWVYDPNTGGGGGGGGGGVSDHGELDGLADDDHPHYLTEGRAAVIHYTKDEVDDAFGDYYTTTEVDDIIDGLETGGGGDIAFSIPLFLSGTVLAQTLTLLDNVGTFTITKVTAKSGEGTCTVTVSINGTPLGGGANSVTTSVASVTHSTDNVVNPGNTITVAITSPSSLANLAVSLVGTRSQT